MSARAVAADLRRVVAGAVADDAAALAAAAGDYGQVLRREPAVVVRPAGTADVAAVLRYAAAAGVPVSPRGTGHSLRGQAGNEGGVVLDLTGLDALAVDAGARRFRCGPGTRWRAVTAAAAAHRLTPPVLTGYPHVTVGGTHSAGGWGDASFRYGAQLDNCTALEAVTGTGEPLRCTPAENAELFGHALGGMGQFAVITAVEHRLRPYRPLCRTWPLHYDDLPGMLADARRLVAAGSPLDSLECTVEAGPGRTWRYRMLATVEAGDAAGAPPRCPVPDLAGRAGPPTDRPTAEFLARPEVPEEPPRPGVAQPWVVAFLPWSRARAYLEVCLHRLPLDLLGGPQALVRVWPARRAVTGRVPMFRVPEAEEAMLLVGIFPNIFVEKLPPVLALLSRVSDLALESGGTRHLASWVHLDLPRWRQHFGAHWPVVNELKRRYDPAGVLNPGFVVYEPGVTPVAAAGGHPGGGASMSTDGTPSGSAARSSP